MAFAVAKPQIADPAWMTIQPSSLLDGSFLKEQARTIRMDQRHVPASSIPQMVERSILRPPMKRG